MADDRYDVVRMVLAHVSRQRRQIVFGHDIRLGPRGSGEGLSSLAGAGILACVDGLDPCRIQAIGKAPCALRAILVQRRVPVHHAAHKGLLRMADDDDGLLRLT